MLQRRMLWMFAMLMVVLAAVGYLVIQATNRMSRNFDLLLDNTPPTLHALNHLKSTTARLLLEAERAAVDGELRGATFENAQTGFANALAEYAVVVNDGGASLPVAADIAAAGDVLLAEALALQQADAAARPGAGLAAIRAGEQTFSRYLEEAVDLELDAIEQGHNLADGALAERQQSVMLLTGSALILAFVFGVLLIRQAGVEQEVQTRLAAAKTALEQQISARTVSLQQANRALQAQLEQREQAEEAMRSSEAAYRTLAENLPAIVYRRWLGAESRLQVFNEAAVDITGYRAAEIASDHLCPLGRLIRAEERQRVALALEQAVANHRPFSVEYAVCHRDGGVRFLLEQGMPHYDAGGAPLYLDGVIFNITARQEAEEEIAQRNRELEALLAVSQRLANNMELAHRLQAITDAVVETLDTAKAASLWLYDEAAEQMVVQAGTGYGAGGLAELGGPATEALVRLVSAAGGPQAVNGRLAQATVLPAASAGGHAVLGVPVVLEDRLLGALIVDSQEAADAFDEHDRRLLQAVVGEAAIAIKNAQLLETTQRHRQQLRQLSQQLLMAREAEAHRISRELHDVLGQALTAISINLAEVQRGLPPDVNPRIAERLAEAELLAQETIQQTRELSLELRPSMLDDLGLLPTLRWYLHRFGQRLNIETSLQVEGLTGRLSAEMETAIYRVVQETLTNVARHAQASVVTMVMSERSGQLRLEVTDDGTGFASADHLVPAGERLGLLGMRERVALFGGTVHVISAPGRGTRVVINLPIATQAEKAELAHA